ncbi:MAG TPA: DUF3137 domain-containing protein [Gemmatimonadaceae bacterium]|nr:DUF3137 domain-containing protein [Gemmatimonadaceae bacterium]
MPMVERADPYRAINAVGALKEPSTFSRIQGGCTFVNAERSRLRNRTIAVGVICVVATIAFSSFTAIPPIIPLLLGAVAFAASYFDSQKVFESSVTVAMKRIVGALSGGLAYSPRSTMTLQQFAGMDLFGERCVRWTSRHEIAGRGHGTKYSIHEVRAGGIDRRSVIFKGIIVRIEFSESFPGNTVIVPDRHGQLTDAGTGPRRKKELVMVKHPAFERLYSVYSTSYFDARQLITPRLITLVMEAHNELQTTLRLSFVGKSLFIVIARDSARPAPRLYGAPITPEVAVGDLARLVPLAERFAQSVSQ